MDADRDGRISASEHAAAATRMFRAVDRNRNAVASETMFRRMDTDKDGSLSRAEFDAGHAALKK